MEENPPFYAKIDTIISLQKKRKEKAPFLNYLADSVYVHDKTPLKIHGAEGQPGELNLVVFQISRRSELPTFPTVSNKVEARLGTQAPKNYFLFFDNIFLFQTFTERIQLKQSINEQKSVSSGIWSRHFDVCQQVRNPEK
jgi:hypothetical protein